MLTREGALGSEYNIWSTKANPEHDLLIPFIRMVSGPMDYEPGLLQNATKSNVAKMGFEKGAIVEARRSGKDWYLAAINDWIPADFSISLSFLKEGDYSIESASDGINAARNPHDYKITKSTLSSTDTVKIKLAPGGGFIARITLN